MAARGPFATLPSPAPFLPDTIAGRLYWHGGVFVLPGTPDSVLTVNGFRDVIRKPGSVMHDYFEARWPVDSELNRLPLAIRQVRYGTGLLERLPYMPWNGYVERIGEGVYREVYLLTIPGMPPQYFAAEEIPYDTQAVQRLGWADEYRCYWERERPLRSLPPEVYRMTTPEGQAPPRRTNKLPQTPPNYEYIKRSDGFDWVSGYARTESYEDSVILRQLGFKAVFPIPPLGVVKGPRNGLCVIHLLWRNNLVVDSLPPSIHAIVIFPSATIEIH